MSRKRLVLVFFAVTLVAVPLAVAKSAAQITASYSGSGTSWTLTIENLSTDQTIVRCIRYFAPDGTTITSVTGPAGWTSTGSTSTSFGFGQQDPGLAPGGTLSIPFTTNGPFSEGGSLHYSRDCVVDVAISIAPPPPPPPTPTTVSPPPPPPTPTTVSPPPPPPDKKKLKPCKCKSLTVKLDPTLINKKLRADKHDFGVGITWKVTCSKGKGGCLGVLQFRPPKVLAGSIPEQHNGLKLNLKKLTFICATNCATSKTARFQIQMLSREQLNKLFGRTLAYTVTTKCGNIIKIVPIKVFVDDTGHLKPA